MGIKRTWAEIDLNALINNINIIKKRVGKNVKIMGVLKANAYGHGSIPIAKTLKKIGINQIAVGDSTEALEIFESLKSKPKILVLGNLVSREIKNIVKSNVEVAIHSSKRVQDLKKECKLQNKSIDVHIKIDTGMGRLGILPQKAFEVIEQINKSKYLKLKGIFTHFSSAEDYEYTEFQRQKFNSIFNSIRNVGINFREIHAANSTAIFKDKKNHYSMVRPGIAMYGINPGTFTNVAIKPVLTLKTQIIFFKDISPDNPIGYGRTYRTSKKTRVAILPIGYNDGYPYHLSNRASVLIKGQRAPVIGRVSMDYITIDVSNIRGVNVGDTVTIIGQENKQSITIEELAYLSGTIPYEIVCKLGNRISRIYLKEAEKRHSTF